MRETTYYLTVGEGTDDTRQAYTEQDQQLQLTHAQGWADGKGWALMINLCVA